MEREHKKKQEALTLEETKQQIQFFETKLTQLKEEKHQHFNTLKKVSKPLIFLILRRYPFFSFSKKFKDN